MPYHQTRWKLDALLPSHEGPEAEKALKTLERKVKKVEGWRKKLKAAMPAKAFQPLSLPSTLPENPEPRRSPPVAS